MASRQNSCLIVEDDQTSSEGLLTRVRELGFDAIHCTGLFTCSECTIEPDAILLGPHVKALGEENPLSNVELLIRGCQIPILAPLNHKTTLLERFQDIQIYPSIDTAMNMLPPLIVNHAKRRNIRDDMVKAMNGINHMEEAEFLFKNLEEAQALAVLLATLAPEKKILRLGLTELFVNAVEHGNLAIGEKEKIILRDNGTWMEEVKKRLNDPVYADKQVMLRINKDKEKISIYVKDEGNGFNWEKQLQKKINLMNTNKSGRGLMIAQRSGLDEIRYQDAGNIVECSFSVSTDMCAI